MNKTKHPVSDTSSKAAAMNLLTSVGMLLIAAATMIPIVNGDFPSSNLYKWLYSSGAAVCLVSSLFTRIPQELSQRDRRWVRIESWSSIFFCVATFFLWYSPYNLRDWLAFTLAGAVIRIIVFFRTVRIKNKQSEDKK